MKETKIYHAALKIFEENFDIEHYISTLFEYPEGEWFVPTNANNEAYSISAQFGAVYLIAMRRTPRWHNGSFQGIKTECLYKKDLNYETR